MGELSVLYALGDRIALVMREGGVPHEEVEVWQGYWSSVCTSAYLKRGNEQLSDVCRLEACLRMAAYYRRVASEGAK